jgi:hypothetical protein
MRHTPPGIFGANACSKLNKVFWSIDLAIHNSAHASYYKPGKILVTLEEQRTEFGSLPFRNNGEIPEAFHFLTIMNENGPIHKNSIN